MWLVGGLGLRLKLDLGLGLGLGFAKNSLDRAYLKPIRVRLRVRA